MRKIALMALPLFALGMSACGGDDSSTKTDFAGSTSTDFATGGSTDLATTSTDLATNNFPAPPTLGAQIDRFGRPGVNTAITDPFWDTAFANSAANLLAHHAKQDTYNAASDPANWATLSLVASGPTVLTIFKGVLAVYDALDGTSNTSTTDGCGNQLAITSAISSTPYATLATVVANDQLFVNTASGDCTTYLAVEASALGITNTDCGGRTPTYDVIDGTYSALAGGTTTAIATCLGGGTCAVTDGVGTDGSTSTTFPFLGAATTTN